MFLTYSIFLFSYCIYIVKAHFGNWDRDVDPVRAWLLFEVIFFFNWVMAGIFFLFFAKLYKLNPLNISEKELLEDDDPWNNRETQDFLCHLKYEFFTFCYAFTSMITTYMIGFTNFYFIELFGNKDPYPTMQMMYIIFGYRLFLVLVELV